jgi:hypothetical protein
MNRVFTSITAVALAWVPLVGHAAPSSYTSEVGVHGFKLSADKPVELSNGAVFDRWEHINQSPDEYQVHDYSPLSPFSFNLSVGVDLLVRYRKYLMIKVGYDYSNPLGLGGRGHISYRERGTGVEVKESKEFSYTSHEVTAFIGPIVSVSDGNADIYLGFSPMGPTWVRYHEAYRRTEGGSVVDDTHRTWHGFFGSCRAVLGMQVKVSERLSLGSEAVFAFLNYMKLESGHLEDSSFRFPTMAWHITARYRVF